MPDRNQWWLVVAAGLMVFMAALDISIVAVALPSIEHTFGTTSTQTEWVALSYLLAMIALALPSGRWLDQVGRRPALLLLVSGFAATSVLAGAAQSFGWLVGARLLQGATAGALFALVPVVATLAVRPEVRGRAFGVISTVGPLGAVTGPTLGGVLTDFLGWRWIFYINAPISVAVLTIVLLVMANDGRLRWPGRSWAQEAVLVGLACGSILVALSLAPTEGVAWAALALLAPPLLIWWGRLPASAPVRALRHTRYLVGAHLGLLTFSAANMTMMYLMPYFLADVAGLSPSATGFTVLAVPGAMAVTGPIAGALADRWGALRITLVGATVLVAGLLLVAPLSPSWEPWELAWRLAVVGTGSGLTAGPVLTLAMGVAPRELIGTVGASSSLVRNLGFALGPAIGIAVWAASGYALGGMRAAVAVAAGVVLVGGTALLAPRLRRDRAAGDTAATGGAGAADGTGSTAGTDAGAGPAPVPAADGRE